MHVFDLDYDARNEDVSQYIHILCDWLNFAICEIIAISRSTYVLLSLFWCDCKILSCYVYGVGTHEKKFKSFYFGASSISIKVSTFFSLVSRNLFAIYFEIQFIAETKSQKKFLVELPESQNGIFHAAVDRIPSFLLTV